MSVKIADFGFAKELVDTSNTTTGLGTFGYVAPEIIARKVSVGPRPGWGSRPWLGSLSRPKSTDATIDLLPCGCRWQSTYDGMLCDCWSLGCILFILCVGEAWLLS